MAPSLLVRSWKEDCIYLVQFPRAGSAPTISSYSLKMETWLRMAGLTYKNVNSEFKHKSEKGQVPFVELNGRQLCDTNFMIPELTRIFHVQLDENLSEKERADSVILESMIQDSLAWSALYFRSLDQSFLATKEGIVGHFTGVKKYFLTMFLIPYLQRMFRQRCAAQGIGRQSPTEVLEVTNKKLKALSVFLGNKKYLVGDKVTSIDATAFGHLSMIYYCPMNKEVKRYMESDCRNLVNYLNKLKQEYWSDWDECTSKLSLDTKPIIKK
ncbi:unnamed protein product [Bursaphelenchus okinawaensis]|uniref:GST C-terminal domain-containing protein n=1 Tax=Bursaphelenchus okinawaensis TaxID=465554 RepID=A0A811KU69_9BILA|nr:unnamed protein product [Bursaphelenchus okinawaensis]CAG9113279.1 unnamed protein product [Bursaphelenchus okinawaensis]